MIPRKRAKDSPMPPTIAAVVPEPDSSGLKALINFPPKNTPTGTAKISLRTSAQRRRETGTGSFLNRRLRVPLPLRTAIFDFAMSPGRRSGTRTRPHPSWESGPCPGILTVIVAGALMLHARVGADWMVYRAALLAFVRRRHLTISEAAS